MPQPGETKQVGGQWGQWDGQGWVAIPAPEAGGQSHLYDSPATAFAGSLMQTAGSAAKGLLHSPVDALKGLLGLPGQVIKGYTQDIPALLRDPSLLKEAPAAAMQGVRDLGNNPEQAGSLLGQLLIGKAAPGAMRAMAPKVGGALRTAAGAASPVLESAGELAGKPSVQGPAVMGSIMTGNLPGAAAATFGPRALSAAGRGLKSFASAVPEVADEPMSVPSGLGMGYDPHMPGNQAGTMTDAYPGVWDETNPDITVMEPPQGPPAADLGAQATASPEGQLSSLQALRDQMLNGPITRKAVMSPEAQDAVLKRDSAYDRGISQTFNDPEIQARRRAALDALMRLDSFGGVR